MRGFVWALFFMVGGGLLGVGLSEVYSRYFAPPEKVPWLAMMNRDHSEYCPIPLVFEGKISPPECLLSTVTPHLTCDCSKLPKKMRPEFEELLAYLREHPRTVTGMLIPPILPGDPPVVDR